MIVIEQRKRGKGSEILHWERFDGKRRLKVVTDFKPYFLVDADSEVPNDERIISVEPTNKVGLKGEPLKRVFTKYPEDVKDVREFFKRSWEADIPFTDRYRIDTQPEFGNECRILFVDIETADLNVAALKPIYCITAFDTELSKYITFAWSKTGVERIEKEKDHSIYIMDDELSMLEKFMEFFEYSDPDIITGWYSDGFDIPYIMNRCAALHVRMDRLSPIRQAYIKGSDFSIKGRCCFDMLPAYKRIHENEMDSYRLEDVAQQELGFGKLAHGGECTQMFNEDLNALIEYNKRDVEILVKLNEKLALFEFYYSLARKTNVALEDTLFNSKLVDQYLLTIQTEKGIALPTKVKRDDIETIKGAKVFEPSKGLKENIGVFDLKSLYPSIIITFNMSPETTNGFMDFEPEPRGLLPTALNDLFEERAKFKREGKDDQQRTVKEIMNSFYGVMLFKNFRLNNRDIGQSITYTGRKIIEWSKERIENMSPYLPEVQPEKRYKVVYGDTDSVFVEGVETVEEAKFIQENLNKSYDEFVSQWNLVDHNFQIEFEAFVEKALFTGKKKRYALLTSNGIKIRGFETRRSNVPRYGRALQEKVLEEILLGKKRAEIIKYIGKAKKYIKSEGNLDDIGVPITLQKPLSMYKGSPLHIRAARYSNTYLGKSFGALDKLLLIYVDRVPIKYPKTDIIALEMGDELPEGFTLDTDKHTHKNVNDLLQPIFDVLDWSIENTRSLLDWR